MPTKREFSDDIFIQKQSFILESIKQNRNRVLFFLAFVLYVLLTVLGTTDRDFFFESGISFPLLNIKLPLIAFYVVVPIIIILIHFNVLYLYQEHQNLLQKHATLKNFYSSMPLGIFDMPIITKGTIHTFIKIFTYLVIYIMPLLTLYILWWHFNKYQSSFYSNLHLIYIALDTLLLSYFLFSSKLGKIFAFTFWLLFFLATFLQFAIIHIGTTSQLIRHYFPKLKSNGLEKLNPRALRNENPAKLESDILDKFIKKYYPHLELSGEYLVNFNYEQLKSLQSLKKSKPLALLQPPLNLVDRSFKYANLSNALLLRVNLQNANLQGGYLKSIHLQEADLQNVNLQGANLNEADLQGANLVSTNLQGTNLFESNLEGSNLEEVNLQGSYLELANLQGALLYKANLQGAHFLLANLRGANLKEANLQGASLQQAFLVGTQSCSNVITNYFSFQIFEYESKETDLNCISKKPLTESKKEQLIQELSTIYNKNKEEYFYLTYAIESIKKSTSAMPDLETAIKGSYTKEEAMRLIENYQATIPNKTGDFIFTPNSKP